jgi:hypothetical protein
MTLMSKRKELEDSNEKSLKAVEDSIKSIKAQSDFVPFLYERKMELEAYRLLINSADDEAIEELHSKTLPIQKSDEQKYTLLSNTLGETNNVMGSIYPSTSGTASISFDSAFIVDPAVPHTPFGGSVLLAYRAIAEYKAHKVEIPRRLSQLHDDLGNLFMNVHNNVDKAKNGIMAVKQAVSDMRDVLNQVWSNLADWSFKKCPEMWRGINNKQFKKPTHHKIVAECVIKDPTNRPKFELLLFNMYQLYGEMSETSIGKNPLSQDHAKLYEFLCTMD